MARLAVEKTPATIGRVPIANYDSTKWNVSSLMKRRTDYSPNFIGPTIGAVARPYETTAAIKIASQCSG